MEDDREPTGILELRLFPLGGVVFFPHAVLPLHIFEPRYRQMTEDALAGDRLVTIVMIRPEGPSEGGLTELEEYGCVGRIFKYQRLPDGRFNMLLVGLKRVRLVREIPTDKLYRIAESEIVNDLDEPDDPRRCAMLLDDFRVYLEPAGGVDADLENLIASDLPLGVLVDVLAHSLNMMPADKQALLNDRRVSSRADLLHQWLQPHIAAQQAGTSPPRFFPPPFSEN